MNGRATCPVADPWAPWTPSAAEPWDLRRAVHLHRRAGFAAPLSVVERDLGEGPEAAIARLLEGKVGAQAVPGANERTARRLAESAVAAADALRLQAAWLWRMLETPDPLGERLTLLWHNHFATSNAKVQSAARMQHQHELLRSLGRGCFGDLLRAVLHDAALLVWLDAHANRKEHPNENLAREVMELFTLGVGHYTEQDVKEAARALSGWAVDSRDAFHELQEHHDDGEKTILGRTGRWHGDDLLDLLLDQPATARRVAFRVCEWLLADGVIDAAAYQELADGLRARELDVGWCVATVLQSRAFFAPANLRDVVLAPVPFVVGAVRVLECDDPPPRSILLAEWCARLGQELFYPPSVFGWPGGRAWISTRSLLGRGRFAAALCSGRMHDGTAGGGPVAQWATLHGDGRSSRELVARLATLWLGGAPEGELDARLGEVLAAGGPEALARAAALLLASPAGQMG